MKPFPLPNLLTASLSRPVACDTWRLVDVIRRKTEWRGFRSFAGRDKLDGRIHAGYNVCNFNIGFAYGVNRLDKNLPETEE